MPWSCCWYRARFFSKALLYIIKTFTKSPITTLKVKYSHCSKLQMDTKCCWKQTNFWILSSTIETYPKPIITFWKFDLNRLVLTSIAFCCKGTTVASGLPTQLKDFIKNGWFDSHKSQTALINANTNLSLNITGDSIAAGLMR